MFDLLHSSVEVMKIVKVKKMKRLKKYQKGDAGATMVIVMLIVALGIFGGRGMWSGGGHHSNAPGVSQQEKTALDLLDEVYARGEISREDYLLKREDLLKR